MFKPRHIESWGERLRAKRLNHFDSMNEEEKCAYHLFKNGSIRSFDTALGNYYWHEVLDEWCGGCPHKETCRLHNGETFD